MSGLHEDLLELRSLLVEAPSAPRDGVGGVVGIPAGAIKVDLPDSRQETGYSCGASCLLAVARYYGKAFTADEDFFVKTIRVDPRIGSHPNQIEAAAKRLGLKTEYADGMDDADLRSHLDKGRPVLIAIQAYGSGSDKRKLDYSDKWGDGHWVVAIGYDDGGIFFEDPSMNAVRGYLSSAELASRWHDVSNNGKRKAGIGLALWMEPEPTVPFYRAFAKTIP